MKMRNVIMGIGAMLVGVLAGCTSYIPHSVSMGGIAMPPVDIVGNVEGVARKRYMNIGPIPIEYGDASIKSAVADALSKRGGDTLINVTLDITVTRYPFVIVNITDYKTIISGTAVRYKK